MNKLMKLKDLKELTRAEYEDVCGSAFSKWDILIMLQNRIEEAEKSIRYWNKMLKKVKEPFAINRCNENLLIWNVLIKHYREIMED